MYLSNFYVDNFRNLKSLQMSFHQNLTVITGKSDTGKSSLLDAIWLFLNKYSYLQFTSEDNRKYINDHILDFKLNGYDIYGANEMSYYIDVNNSLQSNVIKFKKENSKIIQINHDEKFDTEIKKEVSTSELKTYINYYQDNYKSQLKHEVTEWFIEKSIEEAFTGRNLNDPSFELPELRIIREIVLTVACNYSGMRITYEDGVPVISFQDNERWYGFDRLSKSNKIIIKLVMETIVGMFMINKHITDEQIYDTPAIILIDDFDVGLYQHQTGIMAELKDSFKNTQFIITCHDQDIFDGWSKSTKILTR